MKAEYDSATVCDGRTLELHYSPSVHPNERTSCSRVRLEKL